MHVRFVDAGHLLGSASVELYLVEEGTARKLVFSGDIGNFDKPLIRNPQYIREADYVVMESTYGDRLHERETDHAGDLARIVQRTLDRGGNVVIPAFAVGRTQELLYLLRRIKAEGMVRGHEVFPVYVDSPLAVEATHVFTRNLRDCYDGETRVLVERGVNPISFKGLKLSITADESRAINFDETPKVIISASGMCDAGRIRHHLKHNLWRAESTVVFAGYQAEGTLGRVLTDGADSVRLFGEEIEVQAEIALLPAMSSHADQEGLLSWVSAFQEGPQRVFLVHGDDGAMETLSGLIRERCGLAVDCPYSGSVFNLGTGQWEQVAAPVPTGELAGAARADGGESAERAFSVGSRRRSGAGRDAFAVSGRGAEGAGRGNRRRGGTSSAYDRLEDAYEKLYAAVQANQGGANKDLGRFADQLLNLYEKWMR